ncbi:hypothetical protein BG006_006495 [Podila minutissima]|uniref:Uncharacterized protein n=1 Tax=Podila minutissima TaxID=64525 RepID=A0A9P5SUE0_9FUNG|nr:hypothetical protein BG006_006495 [Podila minutissima]
MSLDNDITEAPALAPAPVPAAAPALVPALNPTQTPSVQEIPDYNKMYTGYNPGRDYTYIEPQQQPPTMQQPSATATDNIRRSSISPSSTFLTSRNTTGYGPLDYGYGMTPSVTMHAVPVNMTPFTAPADDLQAQGGMVGGNPGRRRSSVAEFFSKIVGDEKSHRPSPLSSSTTYTHTRRRSSARSPTAPADNLGRRRSSAFTSLGYTSGADGNEHKGPYADVSRCQAQYMERIREAERNLHLTHNKDGLPLPQEEVADVRQRRRSSIAHFFGLDKPLLAR